MIITSDKKVKYLEMLENVIARMSKNSFQLKSWTMTLVAAVAALSSQGTDKRFVLFSFAPIIGFWILDAFYLQKEREYRYLYKLAAAKKEDDIDFSMDTSNLGATGMDKKKQKFRNCLFSKTEILFYLIILIAIIILAYIMGVINFQSFCKCGGNE